MTNNASATPATPTLALASDDPRFVFAKAAALAAAVIDGVAAEQLDLPTPCTDIDVRQLLRHLTMVVRRVTALGHGTNPFAVGDGSDVPDDGFGAAWADGVDQARQAWADDARLAASITLPWAEVDGAGALGMYTNEVTLHTWDLATATSQRPQWDEQVLQVSFDSMVPMLPENRVEMFEAVRAKMPEGTPFVYPYAEAQPTAPNAPLLDRLLAWSGRTA